MQKQETKRQHLLPEFYLKQWADQATLAPSKTPAVWVISKDGQRRFARNPGQSHFWLEFFYDVISVKGERCQAIEQALGQIESAVTPVIRDKIPNKEPLYPDEVAAIDLFVASTFMRTGRKKKSLMEFVTARSRIEKDWAAAYNKPIPDTSLNEHNAHPFAVSTAIEAVTEEVAKMGHAVFIAPEGKSFVTSDDPCVWVADGPVGLRNITIQVSLPLSPTHLLLISHSPVSGYLQATNEDMDEMNYRSISRCDEHFIATSRDFVMPSSNSGSSFALAALLGAQ